MLDDRRPVYDWYSITGPFRSIPVCFGPFRCLPVSRDTEIFAPSKNCPPRLLFIGMANGGSIGTNYRFLSTVLISKGDRITATVAIGNKGQHFLSLAIKMRIIASSVVDNKAALSVARLYNTS